MWTRRQFISRGCGTVFGWSAGGLMVRALNPAHQQAETSASRGMITRAATTAIDQGLAYLAENQNPQTGGFGTGAARLGVLVFRKIGEALVDGSRGRSGNHAARGAGFGLLVRRIEGPHHQTARAPTKHGATSA